MSSAPALAIRNLSKTFGGQRALDHASLLVEAGEVHGLLGQNGSGKSTLIKILAGFHEPDPGSELEVRGEAIALPLPPGRFRELKISFVHQNLGLIPPLTVVENLLLGRLAAEDRWHLDWRRERMEAAALFARYGLDLDPTAEVARLSPVERALLAIVRAVNDLAQGDAGRGGGGLLVLDEPTPFLPRGDVEQLFAVIRRIVAEGSSVIFVSHDVDEVLEITDRATVLRDGRVAGTLVTKQARKDDFVRMIVGRELAQMAPAAHAVSERAARLVVSGLCGEVVDRLDLELHAGEVVGLTGLVGSGYDEVPYLLFGASPDAAGIMTLDGVELSVATLRPADAIRAGLILIPADRPGAGVIGALPMTDNVTMPVLERGRWWLDRRGLMRRTRALVADFEVVPADPELTLSSLSGGNQQKVVLAKWLQLEPKVVLLDEPTQGVDVGARQNVFRHILRAAEAGASVLCASSDYEQLAVLCSRVLVLERGRVVAELRGSAVSKENIAERCYAGTAPAASHMEALAG